MKNEKDMIRTLFDDLGPTEGQISRMERNIAETHNHTDKGSGRKLRLMPILAAALIMTVCITAAAAAVAAPAIKRYFNPGVGVVEIEDTADAPPLYILADQDCDEGADFTCRYGIWRDNSAELWFTSQTRYEDISADDLFGDINATLMFMWVTNPDGDPLTRVGTYRVVYSDITWEEAAAGLPLGEHSVPFTRTAAEYRTYSVEDCGLHLELIPLTDDLTTFIAELSYLDGHADIHLHDRSYYADQDPYYAMALVDALGNTFPLKSLSGEVGLFSLTETPVAEIVGFRADYLAFTHDFSWDGESVTVELPLPADGEAMDVDLEFVFPDGVTKGMVRKVGYNTSLHDTHHSDYKSDTAEKILRIDQKNFPMGYYAVVTEAVEENGIQYWTELFYTDDYYAYLEQHVDRKVLCPVDTETAQRPIYSVSRWSLENAVQHIEHYIPDGRDTVTMKADRYSAIAYGDWGIDFRAAANETTE